MEEEDDQCCHHLVDGLSVPQFPSFPSLHVSLMPSWTNRHFTFTLLWFLLPLQHAPTDAHFPVMSPLASSMFTPAILQIAQSLHTDEQHIIATTTGYVVMLGVGPLLLAPLSETFGRRMLYLICFGVFALLQIPTALSPNAGFLIAVRTISGFFGSASSPVIKGIRC